MFLAQSFQFDRPFAITCVLYIFFASSSQFVYVKLSNPEHDRMNGEYNFLKVDVKLYAVADR